MTKRVRLDVELVRRGLVESRSSAQRAVDEGKVLVSGMPATKTDALVDAQTPLSIEGPPAPFVSRGGEKLAGALDRFDVDPANKDWLDAGASTGGFTDCLLQRGARRVAAVDVGYGQLAWGLRNDDRVDVLERTNARNLQPGDLDFVPQGVVADLSFISLSLVLPALVSCAAPDADYVLLVKPQFEAGREAVGRGGVVKDPAAWRGALGDVVAAGRALGLGLAGAAPSVLKGPAGNVEFFVHLRREAKGSDELLDRAVAEVST